MSLYNIYQQGVFGQSYSVGINQELLDKLVGGYFKGLNSVTYHGKTYAIHNQNFQIYELGNTDPTNAKNAFESLLNVYGLINEALFEKTGINVTAKYLKDFAWGDLKEDYYNLSIKEGGRYSYFLALSKGQVDRFLDDYAKGNSIIVVAGEELHLIDSNRQVQIFNINIEYLSQKRGTVLKNLSEYIIKRRSTWNNTPFSNVGIDVTDEFNIKPFGSESTPSSPIPISVINSTANSSTKKHKIFISHSSQDSKIVTSFVNNILNNAFEIKAEDIFCTSIEGLGIHSGSDFRNAIKEELQKSKMVIQILSEDYKKSEVCLNEMGAAWVITDVVVPFVLNKNKYDIGFLHKTNQQLVLTDRHALFKFLDDYKELLEIHNNTTRISACFETFIQSISPTSTPVAPPPAGAKHTSSLIIERFGFHSADTNLLHAFTIMAGTPQKSTRIDGHFGEVLEFDVNSGPDEFDCQVKLSSSKAAHVTYVYVPIRVFIFYLRVNVQTRNQQEMSQRWITLRLDRSSISAGTGQGEKAYPSTWSPVHGDWVTSSYDISKLVAETFGPEGWTYHSLVGFRLRGKGRLESITLS